MPAPTTAPRQVTVVGAGIVGLAGAWSLLRRGHRVHLVDPRLGPSATQVGSSGGSAAEMGNGSQAALGVLMAQVFHRPRGRAWQLRQRSLALWRVWRQELAERQLPMAWRNGLLLLAADADEAARQSELLEQRRHLRLPLELWGQDRLASLSPTLPGPAWGALHSPADGQLDPTQALDALRRDARSRGLMETAAAVERLEQGPRPGARWRLRLSEGGVLDSEWLILAAGGASADLLQPIAERGSGTGDPEGPWPIEPVLGQALELELDHDPAWTWPGVVVWRGLNLVPRPDLEGGRRCWLGASLEPGHQADPAALAALRELEGAAPAWLRQARLRRQWQGLRPRPVGKPAPLLETVAPGLLLAAGHYRNGVLLAPASAEWMVQQVESSD
jgi:glycine/D-amino acid oxidase-like deaminating enzyme